MDVTEAIKNRRSIRGYKPDPVPRKVLEEIIDNCQWAGSPGNMQPWEFAILGGDVILEFKKRFAEKWKTRAPSALDFSPPIDLPEIYSQRRITYYRENFDNYVFPPGTANVEELRATHYAKGADLYGAPNVVIIYTDKSIIHIPWMIMSIGIIAQNVCLAATSHGLGSCIMGGPVDYPDMLRDLLGLPESKAFICAVTLGYPDLDYKPNTIPHIRRPKEEWVHWYGF